MLLAAVMASRREHALSHMLLASVVLVTVKMVAAWAGPLGATTNIISERAAAI